MDVASRCNFVRFYGSYQERTFRRAEEEGRAAQAG